MPRTATITLSRGEVRALADFIWEDCLDLLDDMRENTEDITQIASNSRKFKALDKLSAQLSATGWLED